MKAFVTGATGRLGRPLVGELLLRGWSVDALVLPEEDADFLAQEGVGVFRGDITDRVSIDEAIEKSVPDMLFHLAAYVQLSIIDTKESKQRMYDVNVNGTRNILESALQHNVKKAVYLSSVAIFGSSEQRDIITEDTIPSTENVVREYGKTKLLAYQEVMNIQEQGLPLLIFIPGIVFGPGIPETTPLLGSIQEGKLRYLPDSYNESLVPLTFIRDIIQAIFAGIERNRFSERYILAESIAIPQLIAQIAEITGKEINFKPISYRKAFLLAWLAEIVSKLSRRTPRITKNKIRSLKNFFKKYSQQFDASKAKRELDWKPTSFKDACKQTVDWFLEDHVE